MNKMFIHNNHINSGYSNITASLNYNIIPASGGSVSPTLTYSQTDKDGNVITSGAEVTYNVSGGVVSASSKGVIVSDESIVKSVICTIKLNGKTTVVSYDVKQAANQIVTDNSTLTDNTEYTTIDSDLGYLDTPFLFYCEVFERKYTLNANLTFTSGETLTGTPSEITSFSKSEIVSSVVDWEVEPLTGFNFGSSFLNVRSSAQSKWIDRLIFVTGELDDPMIQNVEKCKYNIGFKLNNNLYTIKYTFDTFVDCWYYPMQFDSNIFIPITSTGNYSIPVSVKTWIALFSDYLFLARNGGDNFPDSYVLKVIENTQLTNLVSNITKPDNISIAIQNDNLAFNISSLVDSEGMNYNLICDAKGYSLIGSEVNANICIGVYNPNGNLYLKVNNTTSEAITVTLNESFVISANTESTISIPVSDIELPINITFDSTNKTKQYRVDEAIWGREESDLFGTINTTLDNKVLENTYFPLLTRVDIY